MNRAGTLDVREYAGGASREGSMVGSGMSHGMETEQPVLRVVPGVNVPSVSAAAPTEHVEAQAMVDLARWLRARAVRLPDDSDLRSRWLVVADDYATAARLLRPVPGRPAVSAPPAAR